MTKKLISIVTILAMCSIGWAAFARATTPGFSAAALAHHTGNERRTTAQCSGLAGRDPPISNHPPASNMMYWCDRCVEHGGQHYHPDCPVGARCSPDNGAAQCGGGSF